MELGDKVTIGGRTMLRPGFSLVGLTGRIVASRYDAPPGTRAVWIDWEEFGYDDPDLPRVVNVPSIHIEWEGAETEKKNARKPAPMKSIPPLQTVAPVRISGPDENPEPDEERPKLRLI